MRNAVFLLTLSNNQTEIAGYVAKAKMIGRQKYSYLSSLQLTAVLDFPSLGVRQAGGSEFSF